MLRPDEIERIVFICHGNICRSPMAECRMAQLLKEAGLEDVIEVDSVATSTEEIGNEIHPGARRVLSAHGVPVREHRSRQLSRRDGRAQTLFVGMDEANLRNMRRMLGDDSEKMTCLLLDFAGRPGESIADPWYSGDFTATWNDVEAGCQGLLSYILSGEKK